MLIVKSFCFSQKRNETRVNVVKLKAGNVLYADDRFVIAKNDTTIVLPFYIDFYVKRSENGKSDHFFAQIQETAYKHRWSQELHNIILVAPDSIKHADTLSTQKSEVEFLSYRGMIIRKISLQKLDVFGPTIYETERKPTTWIGRAGNKVHFKTNDKVILDHLLIKEGDLIDPYTLADNERLLRELPYIEDARIKIQNINATLDSADIVVVTKDNWSKGLDVTTTNLENFSLDFWDNNILGSGHEIDNIYYRRPGKVPASGLEGYYNVRNINGSFINSRVGYNSLGNQDFSFDIWRDFFTQKTTYAGEIYFARLFNTYEPVKELNNGYSYFPVSGTKTRFWVGRAFPLKRLGVTATNMSNIIVTCGVFNNNYKTRPIVSEDYRYNFQNKTYYLLSYALSSQGYFKSNLVYNYGRTEDIPYGFLLKFTHGTEVNEFSNRLYSGVSFSKGKYIGNIGYHFGSISFGGFLHNGNLEQGMLKLNASFFTNLLVIGEFKFRHFINGSYIKGYKRNIDEFLNINNQNGIRGFEHDSAIGNQKLTLNYETVCFTPYYLAGFRFAFFAFADLAYVGQTYKSIFDNPLYSGFGMGIRFRNERFVFKTFQIRFAYYPLLSKRASGELFNLSDESRFRPSDLTVKSPEILQFK